MIELLQAFWDEVIVRLWNHGTRTAQIVIRVAILVIVFLVVIPLFIWPFVLLGVSFLDWYLDRGTWLTAVATLFPFAAFLIFVVASSTILILAYPLMSVILAAISRTRSFLVWLVVAIAVAVFGEVVIGLYFAFVPVWSWPWLIAGLVALVVGLGLWLVLKRQLRWQWGGWVMPFLTTAIIAVTIAFFFNGWKKEARAEEAAAVQAAPRVEEFTLNAGEEKLLPVETGPGTRHRVFTDKPWQVVHKRTGRFYDFPAGWSPLEGGEKAGPTRVRVKEATHLRFERDR